MVQWQMLPCSSTPQNSTASHLSCIDSCDVFWTHVVLELWCLYWTRQKTFRSWFVIGDWRISTRFVCFVIVIMIDSSEKHNCEDGFWTLEFACLWKAH